MNSKTLSPILVALVASAALYACGSPTNGASQSGSALSAAQCATATPWAENVAYAKGQLVTFDGETWQCIQAHTSEPGWTPEAVPALWAPVTCAGGGGSSSSSSGGGGGGVGSSGACGGGGSSSSSSSSGGGGGSSSSSSSSSSGGSSGGGATGGASGLIFSPYKDTSINMNWNTNVISTAVSGSITPFTTEFPAAGGKAITLAFATGECGSENWAGVPGAQLATANASALASAGIQYIISTGGAAGSFTCGSDSGFSTFINRWATSGLVGVDFDIEAGQSTSVISDIVARVKTAHGSFPNLRFSFTIATLANNNGGSTAQSLGSGVTDSLNVLGDDVMNAIQAAFGSSWPSFLTVDLMTMDFGSPSAGVCVVSGGQCQMGQSALQAAFNLHDKWGVPFKNIELTPMIGQNDAASEQFTLADADTVAKFAVSNGLAGVHYWSFDRDVDCAQGSASATCNSMGNGFAGPAGYLKRFAGNGL